MKRPNLGVHPTGSSPLFENSIEAGLLTLDKHENSPPTLRLRVREHQEFYSQRRSKIFDFTQVLVFFSRFCRSNRVYSGALFAGQNVATQFAAKEVIGDLSFRLDAVLPPGLRKLRLDLSAALLQLQDLVRGNVSRTSGLRLGTGEIAQAADDLSRGTEQQAASLEQTAAALDEIMTMVRKTAEGVRQPTPPSV